jgi:hypothetical protein
MKSQDPKEESFQMMAEHNMLYMAVHGEHCSQYAKQPQTMPAGLSGVDTGGCQCLVFGVMSTAQFDIDRVVGLPKPQWTS